TARNEKRYFAKEPRSGGEAKRHDAQRVRLQSWPVNVCERLERHILAASVVSSATLADANPRTTRSRWEWREWLTFVAFVGPNRGMLKTALGWVGVPSPRWVVDVRWAMPAVIIVYVWKTVGYAAVIFLAGLQGIPKELYEAARVDGANAWERFRWVTLPGLA